MALGIFPKTNGITRLQVCSLEIPALCRPCIVAASLTRTHTPTPGSMLGTKTMSGNVETEFFGQAGVYRGVVLTASD